MCCDNRIRARNICYAQALSATLPQMISVTHNFFHDSTDGSEQGGQDYGLIPGNVSGNLTNGAGHPTFDAYVATSPMNWDTNNNHFCCTTWRMGCLDKQGHGTLDPIAQTGTTSITVHGWAWDERAGRGGRDPVQVRLSFTGVSIPSRTVTATVSRPDLVQAVCDADALGCSHCMHVWTFCGYVTVIEADWKRMCADSSNMLVICLFCSAVDTLCNA